MSTLSSSTTISTFNFTLSRPARYGPRLGNIVLKRPNFEPIQIQTPGILTSTSRGVVPHLSPDNHRRTDAIRWVNVPFETFLEHNPPVPTLQPGVAPLHTFLGYVPGNHILSMSARDPYDGREMPPNGNNHISAYCLRGVKKLPPTDWRSYTLSCNPDLVFSLSDTPFTDPPYSQKRLTKSIERSTAWLSNILKPNANETPLNVLVHMAGGTSIPARKAFAEGLVERLYGPEAEAVKPLKSLDEGVAGYTFDLIPLRQSLEAVERQAVNESTPTDLNPVISTHTAEIIPLLKTSLTSLPETKLRLLNSTESPHEILRYISTVGIDVFDGHWAQRAANIGVALDFEFPISPSPEGGRDIGHNLYDSKYSLDFRQLADAFRGAFSSSSSPVPDLPICPCATCSPISPAERIYHGIDTPLYSGEQPPETTVDYQPPFTRAYINHLLHTHEMSAHSLLVMHNLTVLDLFFSGIRRLLVESPEKWEEEVGKFGLKYSEGLEVFERAKVNWKEVELARGKGRLSREKVKQEEGTLGTSVELDAE